MWLYRQLDRLFPRSFVAKALFVAFVGTHVPLIALAAHAVLSGGGLGDPVLLIALGATLVGTGLTFVALTALLRPLRGLHEAMQRFELGESLPLDEAVRGRDEIGRLWRALLVLSRRLTRRYAEVATLADTDPLTGVLNRRGVEARLAEIRSGVALMIDLDGFKALNDGLGHAAGDKVLKIVARVLEEQTRGDDMVGRMGGDEFLIVLAGTETEIATLVAERLRHSVTRGIESIADGVTISIGLSPIGERAVEAALEQADQALYDAKRGGRNRVVSRLSPA